MIQASYPDDEFIMCEMLQSNTEVRSFNHCCSRKPVNITQFERACVRV